MRFGARIASVAAGCVVHALASATTYVVDASNGPGTDFRRLQRAIEFASDGDVILVRRGAYGSVEVAGKAITIVGNGVSTHITFLHVHDTRADQRVAIAGLGGASPNVFIAQAAGTVVLQDMRLVNRIVIEDAADVRLRNCDVRTHAHPGVTAALGTIDARVEVAHSTFQGPPGTAYFWPTPSSPGERGASVNGGRVHWIQSNARGGRGVDGTSVQGLPSSRGGIGIQVSLGELIVAGSASFVRGGDGGLDTSQCWQSAAGGPGLWNDATTWWSSATIEGGWSVAGTRCAPAQAGAFAGTNPPVAIDPIDPTLDVVGAPHADADLRFVVEGPAGSLAKLWLGRGTKLQLDAGIQIEELTERAYVVDLGVLPAGGSIAFGFRVPAWAPGAFFCAQAEMVRPGTGEIRRTNSIPLIVR